MSIDKNKMPFFSSFLEKDAMFFSNDEVGMYFKILKFFWENGFIPKDEKKLLQICGVFVNIYSPPISPPISIFLNIKKVLKESKCGNFLVHEKLEIYRNNLILKERLFKGAGKLGAEKRWGLKQKQGKCVDVKNNDISLENPKGVEIIGKETRLGIDKEKTNATLGSSYVLYSINNIKKAAAATIPGGFGGKYNPDTQSKNQQKDAAAAFLLKNKLGQVIDELIDVRSKKSGKPLKSRSALKAFLNRAYEKNKSELDSWVDEIEEYKKGGQKNGKPDDSKHLLEGNFENERLMDDLFNQRILNDFKLLPDTEREEIEKLAFAKAGEFLPNGVNPIKKFVDLEIIEIYKSKIKKMGIQ